MTIYRIQQSRPATPAESSNASQPVRRFVRVAPDCYIAYVGGLRFLVDTETASHLGFSLVQELRSGRSRASVGPCAGEQLAAQADAGDIELD